MQNMHKIDLRQLQTFIAVADTGGVARAAAAVNLSQPAASRQIQALEAELGVALFDRVGRRVSLTAAGEDLLRRSRQIVGCVQSLRERADDLKSGSAGVIKIGVTPPMLEDALVGFLVGHRKRHPDVEVHITEDGGNSLASRLEHGEVQVAYIPAGDTRFAGRLLYPIHDVAIMPVAARLSRRRAIEIAELADKPLLLLKRGFGSREGFDAACGAADIRPAVLLESNSHNAIVGLAAVGYGIGIVPSAVRLPKNVRAVPLTLRGRAIGRWTMLAWDPQRLMAPYLKTFIDEFVSHAQGSFAGRAMLRRAPPIERPKGFD